MCYLIANNSIGMIALFIMFCSVVMQFSYLKFRRKAVETQGEITEISKHRFWQIITVQFLFEGTPQIAYSFCLNNKKVPGSEINIFYHPGEIGKNDKSILLTPMMERLNLKKESKLFVIMQGQNRSILHMGLLIFGLILMSFS